MVWHLGNLLSNHFCLKIYISVLRTHLLPDCFYFHLGLLHLCKNTQKRGKLMNPYVNFLEIFVLNVSDLALPSDNQWSISIVSVLSAEAQELISSWEVTTSPLGKTSESEIWQPLNVPKAKAHLPIPPPPPVTNPLHDCWTLGLPYPSVPPLRMVCKWMTNKNMKPTQIYQRSGRYLKKSNLISGIIIQMR